MTNDNADNSLARSNGMAARRAPQRPRVFVLSDFRLLREAVALALAEHPSIELVGSADLAAPLRQIAELAPDALLIDIIIPGGLDFSHLVRDAMPEVKIIALCVAEVEQVVMACARVGVSGFVAPSGSVRDVVAAVHSAVRGELVCSPRTAGMLLSRVSALAARSPADTDTLTPREREIVQLMGDGLSNKQIAHSLGIQSATVKNHVHSILSKLRLRRRGEVVAQSHRGRENGSESIAISGLSATRTVHHGNGAFLARTA